LHWTGGWGSTPDVTEVPGAGDLFGIDAAR